MGYVQFLAWVAKQGLKSKVLQKYLNKAWQEAIKGGKEVLESQFPKILSKAKNYYEGFKRADLKTVPKKIADEGKKVRKQMEKVKIESEIRTTPRPSSELKAIEEGMKLKKGVVNIGDRIVLQMQKKGKKVTFDDILRIYGKKPPHLKAGGGRIDKPLPGRSRDI